MERGREIAPFARQTVELTKQDYIKLKWAASYWQAQYDRAAAREAALQQEIAAHQAKIRDLTQRLYGKKSEKGAGHKPGQAPSSRKRGQQRASKGHGRPARPQLPVIAEVHEVPAEHQQCPVCRAPYREFPGTEDSALVEVHPGAYSPHQTEALPQGLSVFGRPRNYHCAAGPAITAENPVRGVGLDGGTAG